MPAGTPFSLFASAVAGFLSLLGIPKYVAVCIMTMCVSALALTSLDSVARIGRMSFEEFFLDGSLDRSKLSPIKKLMTNKYFSTVLTLVVGYLLSKGGYNNVWPLFGSANQLLSALVLIALSVFLKTTGRSGFMLWVPMCIMLAVTFTALTQALIKIVTKLFVTHNFVMLTDGLQLIFAILLVTLGILVTISCFKKLLTKEETSEKLSA